jgi:asparagine synthase (glutamine-hydrolysing)
MCGIAGFAGEGSLDDLRRMNAAHSLRGPDAEGAWSDPVHRVFLGHRRLSIIDIADGAQPMWTNDGSLGVVFNGEIYNHTELRSELQSLGHVFRTNHSDTEVLLHGYRHWGEDLPNHLSGMWAFALYDTGRQRLFLCRDPFGKKPLYYTATAQTFVFGSELSSLLKHPCVKPEISLLSLKKYFAYGYIPAPHSLYKGVYKLPGGCSLVLDTSTLQHTVRRYWDFVLDPFEQLPRNPEQEWGERIRDLLGNAVRRRLMSDVPLGVFLSGGVDSSSVAALAQRHSTRKVRTFSIGFEEASFDESRYSAMVAGLLGTDHSATTLSLEMARDLLPQITSKLDEPMGDSSLLPTYLLCKETRKHVTVALGGDGADELFAGYDPFRALRLAEFYARTVPKPVHRGILMLAARMPTSHRNMSADFRIKRTLRGLSYPRALWNPVWLGPLAPNELSQLFGDTTDIEEVYSEAISAWDGCAQKNPIDRTLQFYTRLYLQDDILTKIDRASMMNSLEVRAPYLDRELVDFVRRIPHNYKYRHGRTKYILKEALRPLLPAQIIDRPKKGFGVPVGRWFKDGKLRVDLSGIPEALDRGYLNRALEQHTRGTADHRAFLWNTWLLGEMARSATRPVQR